SSASTDQDLSNVNSEIDEATTYTSLKILRTINKCPIQYIIFKLLLETSKEAKKDYEILKKQFLKYW
ncbi:806_t:CDS:2, partial [Gigaspora rosea]